MAVSVTLCSKTENDRFFVLRVSCETSAGVALPEKCVSVSKSAIAEGTLTLPGERARLIADGERRIKNFEAAELARQEFDK